MNFIAENYLLIKSLHVIGIITWMAAILYLPRLFVYHAENQNNKQLIEVFKKMEYRLTFYIMHPGMLVSLIFGGLMLSMVDFKHEHWIHVKLLFVLFLVAVTIYMTTFVKKFRNDKNTKTARFFRIMNEVPTFLMIVIVFLVIMKPF